MLRIVTLFASALLLTSVAPSVAQPESEAGRLAESPLPGAAQVIAKLNELDAFQQSASDRTSAFGRADLTSAAAMRTDAATRRARALVELQTRTGLKAEPASKQSLGRETMLTRVDPADGPSFVRQFYAAQVAEYESTITILTKYLQSPDNAELQRFVSAELGLLQNELADMKAALATK